MLKIIRCLLYSLAIFTGVAGLVAGGVPLAKYALQYLRDREYDYYFDANYLYPPGIIFLLSLLLLIFVHIGLMMGKGISPASSPKPDPSVKPAEAAPAPAGEISPPTKTAGTTAQAELETADKKLTRLLNQNKD